MSDKIEKTGVLEEKEKKDIIAKKLYHTDEIKEIMNDIVKDYIEQVALMKDEEIGYDRGKWIAEFGYDSNEYTNNKEAYEIDIHSCAIILEQIRRFGRIWYDMKHQHHIFDCKK
jgi:hypothetical protein